MRDVWDSWVLDKALVTGFCRPGLGNQTWHFGSIDWVLDNLVLTSVHLVQESRVLNGVDESQLWWFGLRTPFERF